MNKRRFNLAVMLLLTAAVGCAGIRDNMRLSEKASEWNPVNELKERKLKKSGASEEEPNPPVTMTALWKESVYQEPGKQPVRGFGARVFFYDQFNNAVPAKGDLTIYAFDESNQSRENNAADRKYNFTAKELEALYGETGLGPSYSIWCPWDEVGGLRKTIALIPMFRTEDQRLIKSGQSLNVLPGRVIETADASESQPFKVLGSSSAVLNQGGRKAGSSSGNIAQVTFHQDADEQAKPKIKTSTIRMTPSLSEKLAKLRPAAKETRLPGGEQWEETMSRSESGEKQSRVSKAQAWIQSLKEKSSEDMESTESTQSNRDLRPRVFGSPGSLN